MMLVRATGLHRTIVLSRLNVWHFPYGLHNLLGRYFSVLSKQCHFQDWPIGTV